MKNYYLYKSQSLCLLFSFAKIEVALIEFAIIVDEGVVMESQI